MAHVLRPSVPAALLCLVLLGLAGRAPAEPVEPDEIPTTRIPALLGLDLVEARRFAIQHGLLPRLVYVDGPADRLWRVVAQDRLAGTAVRAGSVIEIEVVRPPADSEETRVPGLWGLTEAGALETLAAVGLEARVLREPSRLEVGRVTSAQFPPGSRLRRGHAIEVRIASTPGPDAPAKRVTVPRLVGQKGFLAFGLLVSEGLVPAWRWREAPKDRAGIVFEQDPPAGAEVEVGATVAFVEPALVPVPEVVGLSRARAEATLAGARLVAVFDAAAPTDGTVVGTEPRGGSETNRGGGVRVLLEPGATRPGPTESTTPPPSAADSAWPPEEGGEALPPGPSTWPPEPAPGPSAGGSADPWPEAPPESAPPPLPWPEPPPAAPETDPGLAPGTAPSPLPDVRRLLGRTGALFVRVPDVRGLVVGRAQESVRSAGLVVSGTTGAGGVVRDDDVVASQSPAPGTSVLLRSGVALRTRAAPGTVTLPDFRGRRVDVALRTLTANGLRGRVVAGTGGGDGVVDVQEPAAAARVPVGSEVVLYDSGRPAALARVRVPPVRALPRDEAHRALTALGLRVMVEGPAPRAGTRALATTTIPAAGTLVDAGSTVRLVVTNVPR
jgi:beta-lactam-binding protein with PASTA domain